MSHSIGQFFYLVNDDCERVNVTRPAFIIGANEGAAMNITYALAIYTSFQKKLEGKLEFPADVSAWDASNDLTTAKLIGCFSEWAVLTEFWPELTAWNSIEYEIPEADESKYMAITMPRTRPPRGFGLPGKVYLTWSFGEWATRQEVKAAWQKLQEEEGLRKELDPWRSWDKLV
ncbi:hypothetical protein G7Y89_g5131 [Cudoniella acicularis]|uniref:Uncharacterized protein n=1 Tax=Cudoniella acicularis TaxID=354080 RepID=A0A8H4W602_9HELO|nr:hypothetical protein G7Y89_g5131 [Cudoniella acicularis]